MSPVKSTNTMLPLEQSSPASKSKPVSNNSPTKKPHKQANGLAKTPLSKKVPTDTVASIKEKESQPIIVQNVTKKSTDTKSKKKTTTQNQSARSRPLPWDTLVEGRIAKLPLVFTRDADYFFLVSKTTIKIYSRATGQVVSTLSSDANGHKSDITGLMIHPTNPLQLITSSLDGHVKLWDFLDGVIIRSFNVGFPITAITAHPNFANMVIVAVRKPRQGSAGNSNSNNKKNKKQLALSLINDNPENAFKSNSIIYTVSLNLSPSARADPSKFAKGGSVEPQMARIGKTREAVSIGISPNGKWLVVIGNAKVQVAKMSDLKAGFTKFTSSPHVEQKNDDRMTCMAFHPTEPARLVTADERGRIRIWYCLDDKFMVNNNQQHTGASVDSKVFERHAPSTVLHWHSHAVSSLAFTPNGAHLLSGGEEGVLVIWQLHSSGGGGTSKDFVSRLGAPIASIAIANGLDGREQEYAVGLADGTITFIGSMNMKPNRSFSRIKRDATKHIKSNTDSSSSSSSFKSNSNTVSPLAIHPSTGNLVLASGHPSSIQFYDAEKDTNAMELEIAPSNRVARAEDAAIEPTRVHNVVFSQCPSSLTGEPGEWMVTFDSRNMSFDNLAEMSGSPSCNTSQVVTESSLKFWRWDPIQQRYTLNTRIDKPHSGQPLTSITFSPVLQPGIGYLLVTTATDGKIRTWQLSSRRLKTGKTESYWTCRSCFGYRDTIPTSSSFSPDGSLLAVGQGSFVTLWQPDTNLLQMTLNCPQLTRRIRRIHFVGQNGRFIVVSSLTGFIVWDIVLARVVWKREKIGTGVTVSTTKGGKNISSSSGSSSFGGTVVESGSFAHIIDLIENRNDPSSFMVVANSHTVHSRQNGMIVEVYQVDQQHQQLLDRYEAIGMGKILQVIDQPNLESNVSPNLLALTLDSDVIQFGNHNQSSSSSSIKTISKIRKTLFDDLFGSTILYNDEPNEKEEKEEAREGRREKERGDISSLFNSVSCHLLPPITLLLDEFLIITLPPPPPSSTSSFSTKVKDEEIKVEEHKETTTTKTKTEMDSLDSNILNLNVSFVTDLFRKLIHE